MGSSESGAASEGHSTAFWVVVTLLGLLVLAVVAFVGFFLLSTTVVTHKVEHSTGGAAPTPTAPAAASSAPAEPAQTR